MNNTHIKTRRRQSRLHTLFIGSKNGLEMPSMANGETKNFTRSSNYQLKPNVFKDNNDKKNVFFSSGQKIEQQRKSLPIASVEKRLVEEVRKNDTLIIVGKTGSGKTTHQIIHAHADQ